MNDFFIYEDQRQKEILKTATYGSASWGKMPASKLQNKNLNAYIQTPSSLSA